MKLIMYHSLTPASLDRLPNSPGVYFFWDYKKKLLYVGKAKVLVNRVSQYFHQGNHNQKTMAMVQQISAISYITTTSEHAALLLENEQIKQHQPKYNILLKDDKSFPYLFLTKHSYPRMGITRGKRLKNVTYLGPFTQVKNLRGLLDELQKMFRIRTCTDSFFRHRSRPCLLHQIGRCQGPCVGLVSEQDYQQSAFDMQRLLQGKSADLIEEYVDKMQASAEQMAFEKAAFYRDMIANIQKLRFQGSEQLTKKSLDCVLCVPVGSGHLIQMTWFRDEKCLATKAYMLDEVVDDQMQVLPQFIMAYYQQADLPYGMPKRLLAPGVTAALSEYQDLFKSIGLSCASRITAADQAFIGVSQAHCDASVLKAQQDASLYKKAFDYLSGLYAGEQWRVIECIDISHTFGVQTRASCVRLGEGGTLNAQYRSYRLSVENDDYAAMRSLVKRRYVKLDQVSDLPDLLLIDGGKAQLNAVRKACAEVGVDHLNLMAISKNAQRRSGFERYHYMPFGSPDVVQIDLPAYVRRPLELIRDEAHRFALKSHTRARDKKTLASSLLDIPGIGVNRHKMLLQHFGGLAGIKQASFTQLKAVPGISDQLAHHILAHVKMVCSDDKTNSR